jgi:valyl-tRNA synthetase
MDMDDSHWVVARNEEEAMGIAIKRFNKPASDITLMQDPDVLDTW